MGYFYIDIDLEVTFLTTLQIPNAQLWNKAYAGTAAQHTS